MDAFEDIQEKDIPDLLSTLKEHIPQTLHAYSYLKTVIEWRKKKSSFESYILAPGGDFSDATFFLFTVTKQDDGKLRLDGTLHSMTKSGMKRLEEALNSTSRIDWTMEFLFTSLGENSLTSVKKLLESKGRSYGVTSSFFFWLPWQDAAQFKVRSNEGVEIKELGREHATEINNLWPHRFSGSEGLIADNIELNFGLGVFSKEGGQLLAWGLLWFYGAIGVVGTARGHERRGYASMIVESLTKKMGEGKMDIHLYVVEGNTGSLNMFKKLGFKVSPEMTYWVYPE